MPNYSTSKEPDFISDIAIIGCGPGGLYTTMRLLESGKYKPEEITLFDAKNYFGGRVRTLPLKELPFTADIGAMRYLPKRQLIINSLAKKLKLLNDVDDFKHEVPILSYYLRRRTILPRVLPNEKIKMREGAINVKEQDGYKLEGLEAYFAPNELVVFAILKAFRHITLERNEVPEKYSKSIASTQNMINKLIKLFVRQDTESNEDKVNRIKKFMKNDFGFDYFSQNQWHVFRNAAKYNGRFLYNICLFHILQEELSPEAVVLSQDAFGYNTVFAAANAADHIPWFLNEFHVSSYNTIIDGMSELTDKMVNLIGEKMVNRKENWYHLEYKLLSVIKDRIDGAYILEFLHNSSIVVWKAKKIIFSVSKGALERIHFSTDFKLNIELTKNLKNNVLSEAIQCVTSYPLLKAFMFYDEDWIWEKLDPLLQKSLLERTKKYDIISIDKDNQFVTTRIITDLPIRQIFFHGPRGIWRRNSTNINKNQDAGTQLMIMAYGDSKQAELWASLSGPPDKEICHVDEGFRNLYQNGLDETEHLHGASNPFVVMLTRNLELVLKDVLPQSSLDGLMSPSAVFMQDWNEAPFYGGWHAWCANCKPWEIRKSIQKPFSNEEIFICGEVFSADQGWIEGAFRTSEAMLVNHLNINYASWFDLTMIRDTSLCDNTKDETGQISDYINW